MRRATRLLLATGPGLLEFPLEPNPMELAHMRRLNVRLALWLLAFTVLASASVCGAHYLQTGRVALGLLAQADLAEQQEKPDVAIRYLDRYLGFMPKDVDQLARVARILSETPKTIDPAAPDYGRQLSRARKNRQRASDALTRVLILQPDRHESRLLLARIHLQLGEPDRCLEQLQSLLKDRTSDAEALELLGDCLTVKKEYDKSADAYWKAIQAAPKHRQAYIQLAWLMEQHPEARPAVPGRSAEQIIDLLVTNNADDYRAHLARWAFREPKMRPPAKVTDEAAADVRKALELAPQEPDVVLAAAALAMRQNDFEAARVRLQAARLAHPRDARMVQALFRLEIQAAGGLPEQIITGRTNAIAVLEEGLKTLPAHPQLLWDLTNLLLDGGRLDEAKERIVKLSKTNPAQEAIEYLKARVAIAEKKWPEAARMLQRTRPPLEQAGAELLQQVDVLLAECYAQIDEPAGRLAALERAVGRSGGRAATHLQLAESLWAVGRYDRAIDEFQQGMALPDAPPTGWADLAQMLMIRNLQRPVREREWKGVEDALARAAAASMPPAQLAVLRSEMLRLQGKKDEAHSLLTTERDRDPTRVELWAALAAAEDREKRPEEAWKLLTEAESKTGDVVALRLAKARHLAERGGDIAREGLPRLADNRKKFPEAEQAALLRGLTEAFAAAGQLDRARQVWEDLVRLPGRKDDFRVQIIRFELAVRTDDTEALPALIEELRRIEGPTGAQWQHAEAVRLLRLARKEDKGRSERLEKAREMLEQVVATRPSWPSAYLTRAELEDLKGNPEQAIASYRRAVELGERSPQVVRGLVELLYQRKRYDEAAAEVRRLQQQAPLSSELRRLASRVAVAQNDFLRARDFLDTVGETSTNYRDFLWHGQVLSAAGQTEEAEKKLRRAVELGPESPETWVSLVRHLVVSEKSDEARKVVAQASDKLPAAQKPLTLAQCHELLGEMKEAGVQYEAARTSRPNDVAVARALVGYHIRSRRPDDAIVVMEQIVARKVDASDSDVAWARRGLAVLLSAKGDRAAYAKGLELVGITFDSRGHPVEMQPGSPVSSDELRARAQILAAQPTRVGRVVAMTSLEELARRRELTAEDEYLQAQLHEADGQAVKARELLRSLATTQKSNPFFVAGYAQLLLRQNRATEAEPMIDALEKLEQTRAVHVGDFGSVDLRVRLLEMRGEGRKAVELLRAQAARPDAGPEDTLALIAGLARSGRTEEALDLCEKAWTTLPPGAVGGAALAVLRAGKPTPEQFARVDGWLEAAAKKDDKGVMFLLQRADLMDMQGRLDLAKAMHRQVLARDRRNAVSLNNLAWLLSLEPGGGGEALPLIEQAIQTYGPLPEFLDTRSSVYLALGKSREAIRDLEQASSDAATPSRQFRMAVAYHAAKDDRAAREALQRATAGGLRPEHLHPAEQTLYRNVAEALKQ